MLPMLLVCRYVPIFVVAAEVIRKIIISIYIPRATSEQFSCEKNLGLVHLPELVISVTGKRVGSPEGLFVLPSWVQSLLSQIGKEPIRSFKDLLEYIS